MRKIIGTALAAVLLLGAFAIPAFANATLDELQQAVLDAQADVERLTAEVARLEGELEEAEATLASAEADRDAAQAVVDDKLEALDDAEDALESAQEALDAIVAIRAACELLATNQLRNNCRNPTNPAHNAALADVVAKTEAVQVAEGEHGDAVEVLVAAQVIVDDAALVVDNLEADLESAESSLAQAEADLVAAQAALDAYVAPVAHKGCKGVERAHQNVTSNGNGKGKAAQALETVAAGFGCNI